MQLTGKTSVLGTLTYSAKAPSKFEAIHIFCLDLKPFIRMHDLMITLLPSNELSLLLPEDTTSPQQSVPWINGNWVDPSQPAFREPELPSTISLFRSSVPVLTDEEYQPNRVLISVLFIPAASTLTKTSLLFGFGVLTFLYSSLSKPPFPVVTTAII